MGCICKTQANQQTIKTKLVIVGLEQSGKTAIFEYIKRGNFFETQPTEGYNVDFNNKDYLIFDLAGRTPNLWQHYYQNADGIIFVIDSSKKENLQQVKEQLIKLNQDIELLNIGVLIMFTKSDLEHIDCEAFLEECEALKNTEQEKVWQRCSSKTGEGINEGIQKLMLLIKKQNIRQQKN